MIIEMREGEYWYGGNACFGWKMPIDSSRDFEMDLGSAIQNMDQHAPILLSSKGRAIVATAPCKFSFLHGEIRIEELRGTVELIDGGKTLADAYHAVSSKFNVRGVMPHPYFFERPQSNTWIALGTNQTEENILTYAREFVSHGYRPGILMIDDGWQKTIGDWNFRTEAFADPKGMIDELHNMGFLVMLWTVPIVRENAPAFADLAARGLLLRNEHGEIAKRGWWNGKDPVLDLSHPDAYGWYVGEMKRLMTDYGIDGFKLDAGDPYFYCESDLFYRPMSAPGMTHVFNTLGDVFPIHEYRTGYDIGGQCYVTRMQDRKHSFTNEGLNTIIPNSIAQGYIGCPFNCPDMVGGGELGSIHGDLDHELILRWYEAAALFPMMQISMAPWRILSEDEMKICRKMDAIRESFVPKILALANAAAKTADPIIRSLEYEYPGEGFEAVNDEYLIGHDLLVAPVIEKGAVSRTIRLPKGEWHGFDGKTYSGGTYTVDAPIDTLPYFVLNA